MDVVSLTSVDMFQVPIRIIMYLNSHGEQNHVCVYMCIIHLQKEKKAESKKYVVLKLLNLNSVHSLSFFFLYISKQLFCEVIHFICGKKIISEGSSCNSEDLE